MDIAVYKKETKFGESGRCVGQGRGNLRVRIQDIHEEETLKHVFSKNVNNTRGMEASHSVTAMPTALGIALNRHFISFQKKNEKLSKVQAS